MRESELQEIRKRWRDAREGTPSERAYFKDNAYSYVGTLLIEVEELREREERRKKKEE